MTAAAPPVFAPRQFTSRPMLAMVFAGVLSMVASSGAWAQVTMPGAPAGTGNIATGQRRGQPDNAKPRVAEPDAVPGARARQPVAPATRAAGDMQPTDALFDAINRGDIAAARESLNRGADLNGVNILGMTPMELSVDLGRNDISFLLLSMRGEDSGRGARLVGRDPTPRTSRPVQSVKAVAPVANAQAIPKPLAKPKLFANDGGTPLPGAGFLGFDSRSAAN